MICRKDAMTKREVDRLGDRMKTEVLELRDPHRDLNLLQRVLVNIIFQILMIVFLILRGKILINVTSNIFN